MPFVIGEGISAFDAGMPTPSGTRYSGYGDTAQRLSNPQVGDDYLDTQTNEYLVCYTEGTWTSLVSSPSAHASSHIDAGADAIDGDKLEITWTPSNYTPAVTPAEVDTTDDLTAHLYGIDQALAVFGSGGLDDAYNNGTDITVDAGAVALQGSAALGLVEATNTLLLLENNNDVYLSILAGTANEAGIYFGDSGSSTIGGVVYDNDTNTLAFRAGTVTGAYLHNNHLDFTSTLYLDNTKAVVFIEAAAAPESTPNPGKGQLWVKNDATQKLYFTDDVGTAIDLTAGGTGSLDDAYNNGTDITVDAGDVLLVAVSTTTGAPIAGGLLTLEDTGDTYMTILSGATSLGGIAFGDASGNPGAFEYDHTNNYFRFKANTSGSHHILDDFYLLIDSTGASGTPSAELRLKAVSTSTSNYMMFDDNLGTNRGGFQYSHNLDALYFYSAGSNVMTMTGFAVTVHSSSTWDFGSASSFEIPNNGTPTVNVDGEIALDTTPPTGWSHSVPLIYGGEELVILTIPIANGFGGTPPTNGYVLAYNETNDELEFVAGGAGGGSLDDAYNNGISITVDAGPVNLQGSAGGSIGSISGTLLTIESGVSGAYITFLNNSVPGGLLWSDAGDADAGRFTYVHSTDTFYWYAAGVQIGSADDTAGWDFSDLNVTSIGDLEADTFSDAATGTQLMQLSSTLITADVDQRFDGTIAIQSANSSSVMISINPTGLSGSGFTAIGINPNYTLSSAGTIYGVNAGASAAIGNGVTGSLQGLRFQATMSVSSGTATVSTAYGVYARANALVTGSKTLNITEAAGLVAGLTSYTVISATLNVTSQFGLLVEGGTISASATITTLAGIRVEALTASGATNNYGIWVDNSATYAIFVDSGLSRFDGDGTDIFELPADATANGAAQVGRIPVKIGGSTQYLYYYGS